MSNKTFKCPKCGGSEYKTTECYRVDESALRYCERVNCFFAWSHLNDHLYLKEEQEVVRCAILPDVSGEVMFEKHGGRAFIDVAVRCPGFSGFEFEDGSVSLESPWAWKTKDGKLQLFHNFLPADCVANFTHVLAKFVRIKGAS